MRARVKAHELSAEGVDLQRGVTEDIDFTLKRQV